MSVIWEGGQQPAWAGTPQYARDPTAETQGKYSLQAAAVQSEAQKAAALGAAYAQQGYMYNPAEYGVNWAPKKAQSLTKIETPQDKQLALAQQQFELKKNILSQLTGFLSKSDKSGATAPEITKGPEFTPRPVYSPEQMTAQQNLLRDRSMQHAASAGRNAMNRAGAGGMAANAPLLQALRSNLDLSGRIGGEQGALDWSRQADVANAQQMLAGQQLAQSQHDAYQQAIINRYQAQVNDRNAILQILGGLGA